MYVVIRPQTKHRLAVHISTLQSPVQVVIRCSEYSCQHVGGGYYLLDLLIQLSQHLEMRQVRPTHYTGIDESILKVGIALEQLVPQKRCILKVDVQCNMDC